MEKGIWGDTANPSPDIEVKRLDYSLYNAAYAGRRSPMEGALQLQTSIDQFNRYTLAMKDDPAAKKELIDGLTKSSSLGKDNPGNVLPELQLTYLNSRFFDISKDGQTITKDDIARYIDRNNCIVPAATSEIEKILLRETVANFDRWRNGDQSDGNRTWYTGFLGKQNAEGITPQDIQINLRSLRRDRIKEG